VLTLLELKKDDTMQICMDNRVINKITFKYQFSIPRLDELYGAILLSKNDLVSNYY
jgi:hypothetical protein